MKRRAIYIPALSFKVQASNESERCIWMNEYVMVQNHFLWSYFKNLCGDTLTNVLLLEQWCYSVLLVHTQKGLSDHHFNMNKAARSHFFSSEGQLGHVTKAVSISIQMNFTGDIQCTKGGVTKKSCFGAQETGQLFPPKLSQTAFEYFHTSLTLFSADANLTLTAWDSLCWPARFKVHVGS